MNFISMLLKLQEYQSHFLKNKVQTHCVIIIVGFFIFKMQNVYILFH